MAKKLKCWRNLGTRPRGETAWVRPDSVRVEVLKEEGKWVVSKDLRDISSKRFNKKSNAVKFANSYMKKHDKC